MDHNSADRAWQNLQVHIDQRFGRYLRDNPYQDNSERHGVFGVKSVPKTAATIMHGEGTNENNV